MGYKCRIGDIWQYQYSTKPSGRGRVLAMTMGFIFVYRKRCD